LQQYYNYNI